VAASVPGVTDGDLLQPARFYEANGRAEEYRETVERLMAERRRYLASFPGLSSSIVSAV
jgi:hypothetical protein